MELTPEEGRVLGCLVEKQLTTPQQYPMTENALLAACNQTTSRDPVVAYDTSAVRLAVRSLREQGLLRTVHRTGERSDKHRHLLDDELGLSTPQQVLLALLLLRGPQTAAELRARSERMHAFASVEEIDEVLSSLADRPEPLATRLDRQPGQKGARYRQLLAASGPPGEVPLERPAPVARPDELAELRAEVAELRAEVAELRSRLRA